MTARLRLPAKRRSVHYHLSLGAAPSGEGGTPVHLRLSYYPTGEVGEVWIDLHKEGAAYRYAWHCLARQVSLSLQCGVAVADCVRMLRGGRSEPRGRVVGHESVVWAESLADLMGAVLEAGAALGT